LPYGIKIFTILAFQYAENVACGLFSWCAVGKVSCLICIHIQAVVAAAAE